jgi:hypothetical protein
MFSKSKNTFLSQDTNPLHNGNSLFSNEFYDFANAFEMFKDKAYS